MNIFWLFLVCLGSVSFIEGMENESRPNVLEVTIGVKNSSIDENNCMEEEKKENSDSNKILFAPTYINSKCYRNSKNRSIKHLTTSEADIDDLDVISINDNMEIECWSANDDTKENSLLFTFNAKQGSETVPSTMTMYNNVLFVANYPDAIRVYDVDDAKVAIFAQYNEKIKHLLYCDQFKSDVLFSADSKGLIKLWDINTQKNVQTFRAHSGHANYLSCINNKLYSCGDDGMIYEWDITAGKHTKDIYASRDSITCMTNNDKVKNRFFALTKAGDMISVNKESINENTTDTAIISAPTFINKIIMNKKAVFSAHVDGTIQMHDIKTGLLLTTLYGHCSSVNDIVFDAKNKKIFSCYNNGNIIEWSRYDSKYE